MAESKRAPKTDLPEGWEDWPTLTEAANLIGVTRSKLTQYIQLGVIAKHNAPNSRGSALGSYRINPEDLERLEQHVADESAAKEAPTTADVVRASVDGIKVAQAHAERLVTLFEGPYKYVVDALREENAAQRAELKLMREERAAFEAQRELQRSAHAAEQIALEEVKGEQATKRDAFDLAKRLATHYMMKGVDPRVIALKEAVEATPRETFELLFHMGILPPDVAAKLKIGLDWKEPEAAPPVEPAPQPNGAAS